MRLAARVGFADAGRLANLAGAMQPGCAFSAADPPGIEALFDSGSLDGIRYGPSGRPGYFGFLGGALHREIIDLSRRRACPACLGRAAYHRAAWDFALVTACPEHGNRLLDRCLSCDYQFDWMQPDVRLCRCGADIRAFQCEPVDPTESSASADILAIVAGGDRSFLPAALVDCPGEELARLAMWLGMFRTGWQGDRRTETLVGKGASVVAQVVISGVRGLRDWPVTLESQLAAKAENASQRAGRYGARKTLGSLYDWARDLEPGPVKDAVLDVMRRSIDRDPLTAHRVHRSRLLSVGSQRTATVTLAEARTILGVSHASFRKLLRRGELSCAGDEGRGMPVGDGGGRYAHLGGSGEPLGGCSGAGSTIVVRRFD